MRRMGLLKKTLLYVLTLMTGIVLISYLLVFLLLPSFYQNYKEKRLQKEIAALQERYADQSPEEFQREAVRFAEEKHADLMVMDVEGTVLFQISHIHGTTIGFQTEQNITTEIDGDDSKIEEESMELTDIPESDGKEQDVLAFSYPVKVSGETYTLYLELLKEPLEDARAVLARIFPYAILICSVLSVLAAFGMSYYVTFPIKKMRLAAKDMERLLPEAKVEIDRMDELGELGDSINQLYGTLKNSIQEIEQQLFSIEASEGEKIQYFMTISHELKTPLMSAIALLEGMKYNIAPYDNHERYIDECLAVLNDATELTKKSLDLSAQEEEAERAVSVYDSIQACLNNYRILAASKQIVVNVEIDRQVVIVTKERRFRTAISNIISNAIQHTPVGRSIRIRTEEGEALQLIIENECEPLTAEEQARVFEPYYKKQTGNAYGTGLGLYLTKHMLLSLRLPYRFVPTAAGDGMRFEMTLA